MHMIILLLSFLFLSGCDIGSGEHVIAGYVGEYGKLVDSRDNKEYSTVVIGDQEWMAENLNYNPEARSYDEKTDDNYSVEGRMYSWEEARVACPEGWHLPTPAEWDELFRYAGEGHSAYESLSRLDGFESFRGTNDFGFSASAAYIVDDYGHLKKDNDRAYYWSFERSSGYGSYVEIGYGKTRSDNRSYSTKAYYHVRCIKGEPSLESSSSKKEDVSSSSAKVSSSSKQSSSSKEQSSSSVESSSSEILSSSSGQIKSSSSAVFVEPSEVKRGSFTDERDGREYRYVQIGNQTWMAENLNYVVDSSFCYNDSLEYCEKYGRLYPWSVAMDSVGQFTTPGNECGNNVICNIETMVRGICPEGWHLPSVAEGEELVVAVDKGAHKGTALMDSVLWDGKISTDPYGFGGRPSGKRLADGTYNWLGVDGSFWLSTESKHRTTYQARIFNYNDEWNGAMGLETDKNRGLAVRCLKD